MKTKSYLNPIPTEFKWAIDLSRECYWTITDKDPGEDSIKVGDLYILSYPTTSPHGDLEIVESSYLYDKYISGKTFFLISQDLEYHMIDQVFVIDSMESPFSVTKKSVILSDSMIESYYTENFDLTKQLKSGFEEIKTMDSLDSYQKAVWYLGEWMLGKPLDLQLIRSI